MPAPTGLPALTVLMDDGTGTFPYDITSRCRTGYNIKRGRQDEQTAVTPGELNGLVAKSTDGAFVPGSTIIGSPSPMRTDNLIKVKTTVNAVTRDRFTGYMQDYPTAWPTGASNLAETTISATDALARGERFPLLSAVETLVLASGAQAYYPLDEPSSSSTAADRSGSQNAPMIAAGSGTAPAFGSTLNNTRLGAAQFAAGQYLSTSGLPAATNFTCMFVWQSSYAGGPSTFGIMPNGRALTLNPGGFIGTVGSGGAWSTAGTAYNDGKPHVVVISLNAGTASVYIDGALFTTYADTGPSGSNITMSAGGGSAFLGVTPFTGNVAQAAYWTSALSATQIADISTAVLLGYQAERTDQRVSRIATIAGLPIGTLDTGGTTMPADDPGSETATAAILECVDAEAGLAFCNGSGAITFHNRNRAPLKTSPDVTITNEEIGPALIVTPDNVGLINYFEGTSAVTGAKQIVRDLVSEFGPPGNGHGRYSGSATYQVSTDAEVLDRANWIVSNHSQPQQRIGSLPIDMLQLPAATQDALLSLEPNSWLEITGMPPQTPGGSTLDLMVQGFDETLTPTSWVLVFNVVPRSYFQAWILGDSTYSILGSTTRLYI